MLSPSYAPAQQIVVLRNGEVLNGQVTQTSTNTIVQTEQGSRLVLSKEQVEFVCDSIHDAYWGKSARTRASDLEGQKSLFYWCLKHSLHQEAQNQILLLTESEDAKPSDLEFLDRQLNVAILQFQQRNRTNPKQRLAENPEATSQPPLAPRLPVDNLQQSNQPEIDASIGSGQLVGNDFDYNTFRPLPSLTELKPLLAQSEIAQPALVPMKDLPTFKPIAKPSLDSPLAGQTQTIQQVGFEEEIEPQHKTISLDHRLPNPDFSAAIQNNEATTDSAQPESVTNAQLDRMTRSMPEGTLGPYRSKLERVLINGCNAAKCHDSKSTVMPLMELGRSKPIPRRMSQRNLHQTLKYIDRANPFASPILAAVSEPHAGLEEPILPVGSKHFEQLKLWIIMLSDDPEANYQAYLNPGLQNNLPAQPLYETETSIDVVPKIVPIEPERIGLQPLTPMAPVIEHSQTIGEIPELNKHSDSYQPVDPFDPEIFNRRFGNQ